MDNEQCKKCQNYHGRSYNGQFFVCAFHPSGQDNCPDFQQSISTHPSGRDNCPDFQQSISDWESVWVFSYYYLSNLLTIVLVLLIKNSLQFKIFFDKFFEKVKMGSFDLNIIFSIELILLVSSLLGMGLILLLEKKIDGIERKIRGSKTELILWGGFLGLGSGIMLVILI